MIAGVLTAALGLLTLNMPGSLVHRIGDDSVGMHALARELDTPKGWRALQQRLARALPEATNRVVGRVQEVGSGRTG